MSPDRPTTHCDGSSALEATNMVLSLESSQVILHHHPHYNSTTQNGNITTYTSTTSPTMSSSKVLVLQQNHESYITTNENNGVGNIVLLATEQLDPSSPIRDISGNNDEDLTSLSWLHDKNLLKGINLSCAKVQASQENAVRQISGAISPTSDFLEDSYISEDNASSIHSEQGHVIHTGELITTNYHNQQHYYNNNNSNNKNRNHITSSSSSTSTPTSTLHLSPGGSTVIEYHVTNSPDHHHHHHMNDSGFILSPSSSSASTSNSPTSTSINGGGGNTPHQHFHKKYLREEHVKTLIQTTNTPIVTSSNNKQYNTSSNGYIIEKDIQYHQNGSTIKNNCNFNSQNRNSSGSDVSSSYSNNNSPRSTSAQQKTTTTNSSSSPQKQKHPNNLAYDPMIHTHNKPPFSFSSLIFMAIEDSVEKALPVKEIYAWIVMHFPYFKTAPTGWKNSVRHNLSLNKCFQKVEKAPNMGKGSLWRVEQQYRQNLIQALTRSPFHPCATIDKTPYKNSSSRSQDPASNSTKNGRPLDAELFPRLSKFMAEMAGGNIDRPSPASTPADEEYNSSTVYSNGNHYTNGNGYNNNNTIFVNGNLSPEKLARDWGADSIDDVNAATAMLALKHGPKVFNESFGPPIITSSPSEDHTYSQGGVVRSTNTSDNNSNGTSSDAAYESCDESQNQRLSPQEIEDRRRHAEGVDALLNLAGVSVTTPIILKRSSTDCYTENIPSYYQPNQRDINTTTSTIYQHLSSPTPSKKFKSRNLRTKLKKKVWLR